ncbi:MAG: orotidine-5'-phosphate decarboxylase [Gammaproteobacteria bacterium]|nr:orotidine-5'-phosphate decarboxylase [Gammaproteobacteria bacterium]MYF38481.1 orotidine-5'-phosphate decarboxylase [Gammaproteobacteria bacterium]
MFIDTLETSLHRANTCLCIGLDIDWRVMSSFTSSSSSLVEFAKRIVQETNQYASVYKLNHAFYASQGLEEDLSQIIRFVKDSYPNLPVILDAKRGDIGNTAVQYAEEAFIRYQADAVTVSPYLGWDAVEPFLRYRDKGVILLCRTSNEGSAWIQEVGNGQPVYLRVAERVEQERNPNLMLVVGATQLEALSQVRKIAPSTTLLVPGIGAQGGDLDEVLRRARRRDGLGVIINCSRSIIAQQDDKDYFTRVSEAAATYARLMSIH